VTPANDPPQATRTELPIRFADVDMMGVAHHTTYLHWFEQMRFGFLERILGLSYEVLERDQFTCPLIGCNVRYLQAVLFADKPVGFVRLELHKRASVTFYYSIFKDSTLSQLSATGTTSHCFVKRDLTLLLQTPEILRSAFAQAVVKHPDCCFVNRQ